MNICLGIKVPNMENCEESNGSTSAMSESMADSRNIGMGIKFQNMEDCEESNGSTIAMSESTTPISKNTPSSSPRSTHSGYSMSPAPDSEAGETKSQEKICVVCGDTATGTHFAAMSCEGCKGFFRRSMKRSSQFTCAFENQCTINKSNRKHCQACRLKKCLSAGMNSNLIMSDESVERKRELIRINREKRVLIKMKKEEEQMDQRDKKLEASPNPPVQMMAEDKELIKMMMESHEQSYDFNYKEYETFRGTQHVAQPNLEEIRKTHTTLAWLVGADSNSNSSPEQSPPPGRSGKTKKTTNNSGNEQVGGKKVKAEHPYPDDGTHRRNVTPSTAGDVLEMFGSLHGVSQPKFGASQMSASTSLHRHGSYYSDGSCSSTSTSPYLPTKSQGFESDPFAASFPPCTPVQPSPSGGMMPVFGNSPEMMSEMGPMSFLQGMFMNQGSSTGERPHSLFQHFCDIMTWGIKKVIEFCKCIPEFLELSTVDQINLLRGGCLEMLVLRSYFAFASAGDKYMSDKFEYSPSDFLQAGASSEFVEQYMKVHMRMRRMKLKVEEICLLIGLVLFSPDRPGIQDCEKVEMMQKRIAQALRAYEYTHHGPDKACVVYSELLLLLPVLRTINVLFSNTILTLKSSNENDMDPLILEVNN